MRTRRLTVATLFAALLATAAWIAVPLGAVPVTLQTFVLVLAALLLRAPQAATALSVYLLLGFVGVPVFSGGHSGPAALAGPTGGYLAGFLVGAVLGSLVRRAVAKRGSVWPLPDIAGAVVCLAVVYALGVSWLAASTSMGLVPALLAGVVPFILPDAAKAGAAVVVARSVRRARVLD